MSAHAWLFTAALTLPVAGLTSLSAAQGPGAPVDRAVVAIPPIYPAPAPGLLRLPETQSAPVQPARALRDPVPGGATSVPSTVPSDRPVWSPAKLEAVPAIDARGRVTAIIEHTPGRFER